MKICVSRNFPFSTASISSFESLTTINLLYDCFIQTSSSVTQITSNRLTGLIYTFTLSNENAVFENLTIETDSLTPSVTFSFNVIFTSDICYSITISVKNCASEGDEVTASPTYFSLRGIE